MNLSSALSGVPPEVEEACNTILSKQQQQPSQEGDDESNKKDIIQSVTELLSNPAESLSKLSDEVLDLDLKYARQSLQSYREAIRAQRKARLQCLHLLLASRCSFGSMDAARAFCGNGGGSSGGSSGEDKKDEEDNDNHQAHSSIDMDAVLEKLKRRKETLVDALALEGLDVEEDEEEKKMLKEEESLKPLSWFPGQIATGSVEADEPAAKKAKLST